MATLRDLLYTTTSKYNYDYANTVAVQSAYPQGCVMWFMPLCTYTSDTSYNNNCMCAWCAPSGTTQVTFEIWGGGGGGPGACCCQQGQPGGSGAYAKKTVAVTGGETYTMVIGTATDCSASCCGIQGCKTYITGPGLTNFCAEGGLSGKSCCYVMWGNYYCAGNSNGYVYLCYDATDYCSCYYGADEGAPGRPGFLWSQCSCGPCYWKYAIPFPGGLTSKCGGHVMVRNQGNACFSDWLRCIYTIGMPYDGNNKFLPGVGGIPATSCGGGCCYGYPGSPGAIRVTYR